MYNIGTVFQWSVPKKATLCYEWQNEIAIVLSMLLQSQVWADCVFFFVMIKTYPTWLVCLAELLSSQFLSFFGSAK